MGMFGFFLKKFFYNQGGLTFDKDVASSQTSARLHSSTAGKAERTRSI